MSVREWTREEIEALHGRYMEGATLRELGEELGVTYERVRQLFKQHDLPTKKFKRQTIERYAQEYDAWQRRDEIIEAYKEHGTIDDVARITELPRQYIGPVIATFEFRHLYRRKRPDLTHDPESILEALRAAAELCGEPLTIPAYRKVAPAHKFPADLTVVRAFDTWEAACQAAGVKANPSEGPRKGSITAAQCLDAIRRCGYDLQKIPSYDAYCKWARAAGEPSGPTVRVKIGPWREALLLAFHVE
jgi:hypothetical protein